MSDEKGQTASVGSSNGSAALTPLPEVNPDLIGHSYAIALLRDSITYHKTNERTDPECSWARIFELRSAIKLLSSPNDLFGAFGDTKMTLTKEQEQQMLEAAKPLIKWMNENCHPHCSAHVDQNTIELTEGVAINRTDEFLRD